MDVIVVDTNKKALAPTTWRRAKMLLDRQKAAVFRAFPFTIILKKEVKDVTPTFIIKLDPDRRQIGKLATFSRTQSMLG